MISTRPALAATLFASFLCACGGSSGSSSSSTAPPTGPTVSFVAVVQDAPESGGAVLVTVSLSSLSNVDISVPFTVTGTATLAADYVMTASPLVITAGDMSGTISIAPIADTLFENDETIQIVLGAPSSGALGAVTTNTTTITLAAPEFEPNNSVNDSNIVGSFGPGSSLDITGALNVGGMDLFDVFRFEATVDTLISANLAPSGNADVGVVISSDTGAPLAVADVFGPGAAESTAVSVSAGTVIHISAFSVNVADDYVLTVTGASPLVAASGPAPSVRPEWRDMEWTELVSELQFAKRQARAPRFEGDTLVVPDPDAGTLTRIRLLRE